MGSVITREPAEARLLAKELQLTMSSQERTLYFHGESMRPFLGEGDEVVVIPVRLEDVRRGDVITYRNGEFFPTRRFVRRVGDRLEMWCENWPDRYFATRREDILGLAVARKRNGAWITHRDREWRAARRAALVKYGRLVAAPRTYRHTRALVGRFLRWTRLRKSRAVRGPEVS